MPFDLKTANGRAINTSRDPETPASEEKDRLHVNPISDELEERTDASLAGRDIFGFAQPIVELTEVPQISAVWRIYARDSVGSQTHKKYAIKDSEENIGFVHKWSERQSLFLPLAFINEFSLSTTGLGNSYGKIAHTIDHNIPTSSSAFSFAVWIKNTNTAGYLAHKMNGANSGWNVQQDGNGRIIFIIRGGVAVERIQVRTDSLAGPLNDGDWHLIVITKAAGSFAASSVKVYVDNIDQTLNVQNDGLLVGSVTANANDLGFCATNTGGTRYDGHSDEPAIWKDIELTSDEAEEIWNDNSGTIDLKNGSGNIKNVTSWWRYGDGSYVSSNFPNIPDEISGHTLVLQAAVVEGDLETEVPP